MSAHLLSRGALRCPAQSDLGHESKRRLGGAQDRLENAIHVLGSGDAVRNDRKRLPWGFSVNRRGVRGPIGILKCSMDLASVESMFEAETHALSRCQSIVLCTHRNPHWRHGALVVRILALHPLFCGASSFSHKRQRLRKATSSTTRRSASELSMHSVKRREPAQRKVNRDRRQGINQSDRHHIVPWRLVAVEELIDGRRHGHVARR
jgi:hypothetical protein